MCGMAVVCFGARLCDVRTAVSGVGCSRFRPSAAPYAVGAYITAAYWFTASTSFANPAVTMARAASDTFAGIRPVDVIGFVVAQMVGPGSQQCFGAGWLLRERRRLPRDFCRGGQEYFVVGCKTELRPGQGGGCLHIVFHSSIVESSHAHGTKRLITKGWKSFWEHTCMFFHRREPFTMHRIPGRTLCRSRDDNFAGLTREADGDDED